MGCPSFKALLENNSDKTQAHKGEQLVQPLKDEEKYGKVPVHIEYYEDFDVNKKTGHHNYNITHCKRCQEKIFSSESEITENIRGYSICNSCIKKFLKNEQV